MRLIHSHLSAKRHVIWDWNGTLLNDLEHAIQIVNRMLIEEGLPPTTLDRYKQIFGFPVIDYYKKLGFDTSPEPFFELCERFNRYFKEGLPSCSLWPGARETLAEIKASGKTQSVLSASEQGVLNESIQLFQLDRLFDHIYGISDKAAGSKVARGHELIKAAQMKLSETVLIGDTDHDLEVGKALGIDVILVDHGHQDVARLIAVHSKVVKILA